MIADAQSDPITQPKRSRICGRQSKNGCFTCKARRIKCDEEKPSCLRCARSGRDCLGYPNRTGDPIAVTSMAKDIREDVSLLDRPQIASSPSRSLAIGCIRNEQQHRLAQCGLNLLSFDSLSRFGAAGAILNTLLPQLCLTIPSINAATTALGAIHRLHASWRRDDSDDEAFVAFQYRVALRAMQTDLFTQPDGPIPLIMICFILSVAEILLHQEANALFHLRAASRLLQDRRNAQLSSHLARYDTFDTDLRSLEDEIGIILRTVDFQICSYAPSKPPDLPAVSVPSVLPSATDLSTAHVTLVQLVHACYDFACAAYKFKYQPQSTNPSIYIEQGRHIAHLSAWLEQFNLVILPQLHNSPTEPLQAQPYCHALTLRMTALSILVHLSCILIPYETAYNTHAPHFQQIVVDGETIMSMRHRELDGSFTGTGAYRFTTGPGLIQPLFLTAFKYRHRLYRRRAIALLAIAGREGPWCGRREARITSRIMELEEMCSRDSSLEVCIIQSINTEARNRAGENVGERLPISSPATPHQDRGVGSTSSTTASNMTVTGQALDSDKPLKEPQQASADRASRNSTLEMPEPALINDMGMSSDTPDGQPSNSVIVRFSKCKNMKTMLSYPCGHGLGQAHNLDSHVLGPCPNNPLWDRWQEVLEI